MELLEGDTSQRMKKIIVVEDETFIARDIKNMLTEIGYEVSAVVSDGEEAVKKVAEIRPSLVLMDVMLHGEINGVKAARKIYNHFNIPVVYLTAYADQTTLDLALKTGPFGYILKPFNERELQTSIETALYKHKMEKKLREREQWLSTVLRSIGDAVIATDGNGVITFMNSIAEGITGWKNKEALHKPLKDVFNIVSDKKSSQIKLLMTRIMKKDTAELAKESILITKDMAKTPIDYVFAPIRDEKRSASGTVLVFRDIAERKRTEEELNKSYKQLRDLSAHLQSVREDERTTVAREIHDELGQALTALKLDISWLSKRLPKREIRLLNKAQEMSKLTDMTIQKVKKISTELRPGLLDDLGLASAIEWQAEEFQKRTGIKCKVRIEPKDIILDEDRSTSIFRIYQETLTNVARHANATVVRVDLKETAGMLRLNVSDNGKGITEKQISNPKSFGLLGIRERVYLWTGKVKIKGVRGKGTSVIVSIPTQEKIDD